MAISTHAIVVLIGLIFPLYILLTYKKANDRLKNDKNYKVPYYKQLITIFWVLAGLVIASTFLDPSITLNFYPTFNTIGIILAVAILVFIIALVVTSKIDTEEKAKSTIKKIKEVYHFLPKSRHEHMWFNALSITAGICEEVIFRLFMFSYISMYTNLVVAFLLTNFIFALTHIDTSKQNTFNAFLLGLLFTTIYYFTDNIWLPIVLHIAIDASLGYLGYHSYIVNKKSTAE